jgi:N-acetylmuramoyl-L-alanine amidase
MYKLPDMMLVLISRKKFCLKILPGTIAIIAMLVLSNLALFAANEKKQEDISISDLAYSLKATLEYDPLVHAGTITKEGRSVRFAVDVPYVLLDWTIVKEVPAPYESVTSLQIKKEFAQTVQEFFELKPRTSSKYLVKAIVIDPGHGGKDPGAIGEFEDFKLQEKDVNLSIALRLADLLRLRYPERTITLTRSSDIYPTLEERVEMANKIKLEETEAIIYISIHANASFNKNTKGFEVWYLNPNYRRTVVDEKTAKEKGEDIAPIINIMLEEEFTTESIILAQKVYQRMDRIIGDKSPARGIRAEEWFVVRNAKMPSILIEVGFVTNKSEALLLSQAGYLRQIADAIYNGVCDFIEHFEQ